jgi:hypothetical protein
MKYLNAVETRQTNRSPFSPQEIDEHEDAERIWAIIAEIKREAKDACQKSWTMDIGLEDTTKTKNKTLIWCVMDGPYAREDFPEDEFEEYGHRGKL